MTESGSGMNVVSAIQPEKYDCDLVYLWQVPLSSKLRLTQCGSCTFSSNRT